MGENAIVKFFQKIHLLVFDSKFLASEVFGSTLRKVFMFLGALFIMSLVLSSVSRVIKLNEFAPNLIHSALGTMEFENYVLTSPDTLKIVDGWRLNELITLISGVKMPLSVSYPIEISVGGDTVKTTGGKLFVHVGKTEFSTNVMSRKNIQSVGWDKILKTPNIVINEKFYKAYFGNPLNKIGIFLGEILIIGFEMFKSILQIGLSILIYLLFFGKKLKFPEKLKLIMFSLIPYLIIMPVSLFAAKNILFVNNIALICAVIIAIRAIIQSEKGIYKNETA